MIQFPAYRFYVCIFLQMLFFLLRNHRAQDFPAIRIIIDLHMKISVCIKILCRFHIDQISAGIDQCNLFKILLVKKLWDFFCQITFGYVLKIKHSFNVICHRVSDHLYRNAEHTDLLILVSLSNCFKRNNCSPTSKFFQ